LFIGHLKGKDCERLVSLACVASVPIGFSACLKHFPLFWPCKNGVEGKIPLPLPQYPSGKKQKEVQTCGKANGGACYAVQAKWSSVKFMFMTSDLSSFSD